LQTWPTLFWQHCFDLESVEGLKITLTSLSDGIASKQTRDQVGSACLGLKSLFGLKRQINFEL
jgi:hypothetical protein